MKKEQSATLLALTSSTLLLPAYQDARADAPLIDANFSRPPAVHHEGITWAVESAIKRGDEKIIERHRQLTNPSPPGDSTPAANRNSDTPESNPQPNIPDTTPEK